MDGDIGVESEPGKGSTFWFTARFAKQPSGAQARPRPTGHLAGVRVLIVDDNQTNRTILEHQLGNWQMLPACAASGFEALPMLRQAAASGERFDLVVLDMQMPHMDGLTLARSINADVALSGTRLVMLTSMGERLDEETMRLTGISACLDKPVKQSQLFDTLATTLAPVTTSSAGDDLRKAAAPSPAEDPTAPAEKKNLRILIAEDNLINQEVALGQLEKLGYTADVANNGQEALEALHRKIYDLVLMDCQMPELDGYAAAAKIRENEKAAAVSASNPPPRLRIIAMTAHAMQGDREKCLAAGMDDYITKPVQLPDLQSALERAGDALPPASAPAEPGGSSAPAPAAGPEDPDATLAALVDRDRLREVSLEDPARQQRLTRLYFSETAEHLSHLAQAVDAGDPEEVKRWAHKCVGASASMGMVGVAAPLRELERAVADGRKIEFSALLRQAEETLQRTRQVLAP